MFHTDDPASDWESYCSYLDRINEEWHKENDKEIREKIEDIECLIIDLKKCKILDELEDILDCYETELTYDYCNNETFEEIKDTEIKERQEEKRLLERELKY